MMVMRSVIVLTDMDKISNARYRRTPKYNGHEYYTTEISQIAPPTSRKRKHIRLPKVNEIVVCIFHGKLLGLLADFATERPVRRQFRDGIAHFDPRET